MENDIENYIDQGNVVIKKNLLRQAGIILVTVFAGLALLAGLFISSIYFKIPFISSLTNPAQTKPLSEFTPFKLFDSNNYTLLQPGDKITGKSSPSSQITILIAPGDTKGEIKTDQSGSWEYIIPDSLNTRLYLLTVQESGNNEEIKSLTNYHIQVIKSRRYYFLEKVINKFIQPKKAEAQSTGDPRFEAWKELLWNLGVVVVEDASNELIFFDRVYFCSQYALFEKCPALPKDRPQVDYNQLAADFAANRSFFFDLRNALYDECYQPDDALLPYFPEIQSFLFPSITVPKMECKDRIKHEIDEAELIRIYDNQVEIAARESGKSWGKFDQLLFDSVDFFLGTRALLTLAVRRQEQLSNEEKVFGALALISIFPPGKGINIGKNVIARLNPAAKDFIGKFRPSLRSTSGITLSSVKETANDNLWVIIDRLPGGISIKEGAVWTAARIPEVFPQESLGLWTKIEELSHKDKAYAISSWTIQSVLEETVGRVRQFMRLDLPDNEIYEISSNNWAVVIFGDVWDQVSSMQAGAETIARTIIFRRAPNREYTLNLATAFHEIIHYLGYRVQKTTQLTFKLENVATNPDFYYDQVHLVYETATDLFSLELAQRSISESVYARRFPQIYDSMQKIIEYMQKYSNNAISMEDFYKFSVDANDEELLKKMFNTQTVTREHADAFVRLLSEKLDESKIRSIIGYNKPEQSLASNQLFSDDKVLGVSSSSDSRRRIYPPLFSSDADILKSEFRQKGAGAYFVQPVILVPSNESVSSSELDRYKQNILNGLNDAQSFYRNEGKGGTFRFQQGVKVVNSQGNIDRNNAVTVEDVFRQADGYNLVSTIPEQINIVWVVGSDQLNNTTSNLGSANSGYALLNQSSLVDISSLDAEVKSEALREIAHQLGHAFGLEEPCAHGHSENCEQQDGTYPPESEFESSIIGDCDTYPDCALNSSVENPETKDLCNNLFTNPFINQCSIQLADTSVAGTQTEFTLSSQTVSQGQTFSLNSSGIFGSQAGEVHFYPLDNDTVDRSQELPRTSFNIVSWSPTKIDISIVSASEIDTFYEIELKTTEGATYSTTPSQRLQIRSAQAQSYTLTVNYWVRCGDTNTPMASLVDLQRNSSGSVVSTVTYSNNTSGFGKAVVDLSEVQVGDRFTLTPQPLNGINPDSNVYLYTYQQFATSNIDTNASFHYPTCPEGYTRTIQSITVNGNTINNDSSELQINLRNFQGYVSDTQSSKISVPFTIQYNDGSTEQKVIRFNYNGGSGGGSGRGKVCVYSQQESDGQTTCHKGNCTDGSQNCSFNRNCSYVEGVSTGETVSCPGSGDPVAGGKECIYSQDGACHKGNCLDGSDNCSFNVNCGYVPGYSSGDTVACPGDSGSCQPVKPKYDVCKGEGVDCATQEKHQYEVTEYAQACGGHGKYVCRDKGYIKDKCGVPKCGEDKTYCDDGKEIRKHGGYYDPDSRDADGDGCVYAFDKTGNSCGGSDGGNQSCSDNDREFAGCVENTCGKEYWRCPDNRDDIKTFDSPGDGDCRNPERNSACQ